MCALGTETEVLSLHSKQPSDWLSCAPSPWNLMHFAISFWLAVQQLPWLWSKTWVHRPAEVSAFFRRGFRLAFSSILFHICRLFNNEHLLMARSFCFPFSRTSDIWSSGAIYTFIHKPLEHLTPFFSVLFACFWHKCLRVGVCECGGCRLMSGVLSHLLPTFTSWDGVFLRSRHLMTEQGWLASEICWALLHSHWVT